MSGVTVYGAGARVGNQLAMKQLLMPLPSARQLLPLLKTDCIAHQWDPDLQIDFWIFSNGRNALRLWIEGLTEQQAVRSRELFAARARVAGHGRIAWVKAILIEAVTGSPPPTTH